VGHDIGKNPLFGLAKIGLSFYLRFLLLVFGNPDLAPLSEEQRGRSGFNGLGVPDAYPGRYLPARTLDL
jgi:hypothetical protein